MKCVILAAGEGIRMRPLTLEKPKALLRVAGKTLLEHIINALPKEIDELILVIGYKGEQIKSFLGEKFNGFKVRYVWQKEKTGTGRALQICQPFLGRDKFLMFYGDDLYDSKGLENLLKYDLALAVNRVADPSRFGVVLTDQRNKILEIEEKPENPKSNLISTGAMMLDARIFNYPPVKHSSGEYFLTTMIDGLVKEHDVFAVSVPVWIPIGFPEDLKKAEDELNILFTKRNF
ncbi:MAG: sugar phosphate nucleotidyltransferase [Patescibacteria group bacterium]